MSRQRMLITVALLLLFTSAAVGYSTRDEANADTASPDQLEFLISELESMVERGHQNQAASPAFLADLSDLLERFRDLEALCTCVTQTGTPVSPYYDGRFPVAVLGGRPDMTGFTHHMGEVLHMVITGSTSGTVWGTDVYTHDSNVNAAAVHAGIVRPDETTITRIRMLPGRESYAGSTRHGVESRDYGSWAASFEFLSIDPNTILFEDPENMVPFSNMLGETLAVEVTGTDQGTVWGTDVYTADSNLAAAAVHAGVVRQNETAVVLVTMLAGQESYAGSSRKGITSRDWGSYRASYRVQAAH